jgi:hypothetical protein
MPKRNPIIEIIGLWWTIGLGFASFVGIIGFFDTLIAHFTGLGWITAVYGIIPWYGWIMCSLVIVSFRFYEKAKAYEEIQGNLEKPKNEKALSINFGHGWGYESEKPTTFNEKNFLVHGVSVSVKNGGTEIVSNCKFYTEVIGKDKKDSKKLIVQDSFEVFPNSEPRFINIATYSQSLDVNIQDTNRIEVQFFTKGGFITYDSSFSSLSATEEHVICFSVESLDKEVCRAMGKLYVENKKLKLVKI